MATVSGIPAWRIPPREEPGGLQSMVFQSRTGLRDFHFHSFDGGCLFPPESRTSLGNTRKSQFAVLG